jgi:hypothetical protein
MLVFRLHIASTEFNWGTRASAVLT